MTDYRRRRHNIKRLAVILISAAIGLVAVFLIAQSGQPSAAKPTNPATKAALEPAVYHGLPVRLKIPAIGVDTAIEYMGIDANGNMAVPAGATDAGWYKFGAIPGEKGSAVIAGHVVGSLGQAGVFLDLDKLKAGDILSVTDAKSQEVLFTVRELRSYGSSEQPSEVFNSGDGTHLNLITCSGDWDALNHHYLSRLVVFADKD